MLQRVNSKCESEGWLHDMRRVNKVIIIWHYSRGSLVYFWLYAWVRIKFINFLLAGYLTYQVLEAFKSEFCLNWQKNLKNRKIKFKFFIVKLFFVKIFQRVWNKFKNFMLNFVDFKVKFLTTFFMPSFSGFNKLNFWKLLSKVPGSNPDWSNLRLLFAFFLKILSF